MCYRLILLIVGFIWVFSGSLQSQIIFELANDTITDGMTTRSLSAKCSADLNGDYRDDMVLLHGGKKAHILSHSSDHEPLDFIVSNLVSESVEWTSGLIDLNNDGHLHLYTGGFYNGVKLHSYDSLLQFQTIKTLEGSLYAQGSSVVDINNDGFNDLFVCDDDGLSAIYMNNGSGDLVLDPTIIDMQTDPSSDNSGNYGVVWFDIDNDNDIDCYLSKCRIGATEATDPRRINALFINDGSGNFTEEAASFNLADGSQTWAADYADFDNDGDFDLYIANHEDPHRIMINHGNQSFEEIIVTDANGNPFQGGTIQSICEDFDNNGFTDILISGFGDAIIWNHGNLSFEFQADPFGTQTSSAGVADLNNDGFWDIISSYQGTSIISERLDRVYLNQANSNHYIKLSFLGVSSNRQGISAKVQCYAGELTVYDQVCGGTSYSAFTSQNINLGLGTEEHIDSVHILWPSGQLDKYYDLSVDQHLLCVEGLFQSPLPSITSDKMGICEDQETILMADEVLHWSTGDISQSIQVTDPGMYRAWKEVDGIRLPSNIITLELIERPSGSFNLAENLSLCDGQSILVLDNEGNELVWNTGETQSSIIVDEAGIYTASSSSICGLDSIFSINVEYPDIQATPRDSIIAQAGNITLATTTPNTRWYKSDTSTEALAEGQYLDVELTHDTTLFYSYHNTPQFNDFYIGPGIADAIEEGDFANLFHMDLFFQSENPLQIDAFSVVAEFSGKRGFMLMEGNELIDSIQVFVPADISTRIFPEAWIVAPNKMYSITTDKELNQAITGTDSPGLLAISKTFEYPIRYNGISILGGNIASYYPPFLDLKASYYYESCEGDRAPFDLRIVSEINEIEQAKLSIFPNPSNGQIQILGDAELSERVQIHTCDGRMIGHWTIKENVLDLSALDPGLYLLHFTTRSGYPWVVKLIIQ